MRLPTRPPIRQRRLESTMLLNKTNDLVICLGDCNAVTGLRRTIPSPIGPYGSGLANDNTDRFVSFCEGAQLRIAGSWFQRKDIHRHTWLSNDGLIRKGQVSAFTVFSMSGTAVSSVRGPSSVGATSTSGLSGAGPSTTGTVGGSVGTEPGCPKSDSGGRFPKIEGLGEQMKVSVGG